MEKKTVYELRWQKPQEKDSVAFVQLQSVYVFTEEELLELKKMWADDAFENGYSRCCWEETNHPKSHSVIDKEYYINNLTI